MPHTQPLAAQLRPQRLEDIIGQDEVVHSPITQQIATGRLATSVLLYGPPGVGKTTLARCINAKRNETDTPTHFVELSAVNATVADIRKTIEGAKKDPDTPTIVFIDEIHRFAKNQQDSLLHAIEDGTITIIGATTHNPAFALTPALLSRCITLKLKALDTQALHALIDRAAAHLNITISDTAREGLIRHCGGDPRVLYNHIALAHIIAQDRDDDTDDADNDIPVAITHNDVEAATGQLIPTYDADGNAHYDITSAWIKSMRGSDPQAALYWLARMIEGGEDPRFIARRLCIHAAEDVGLADPSVLQTATAAHYAVSHVGMPEARIILSEACLAITMAPKSNAAYKAISNALALVEQYPNSVVPDHLRDAHYVGAKQQGAGIGYLYPHDYPHNVVAQPYLPEEVARAVHDTPLYTPTTNGAEAKTARVLQHLRESYDHPPF